MSISPYWTIDSLRSALSTRQGHDKVIQLRGDDAIHLADALDRALDSSDIDDSLRSKCTVTLRRLCGKRGILPSSHTISQDLILTSENSLFTGGFADVWKGDYAGRPVAIKAVRFSSADNLATVKRLFCKEALTWKRLSHANILPFLGAAVKPLPFCLVSPWMAHGNVVDYVKTHPEANRMVFLVDVASGLSYLHSLNLIHGDLKGANILINNDLRACLADFGLARIMSDPRSAFVTVTAASGVGTLRWMAPELLDPEKFGVKDSNPTKCSDIYALAMVILQVLTGHIPFYGINEHTIGYKVINGDRPPRPLEAMTIGITDDIWRMMEYCWHQDRGQRMDISTVLRALNEATRYWVPSNAFALGSDSEDDSDDFSDISDEVPYMVFSRSLNMSSGEGETSGFVRTPMEEGPAPPVYLEIHPRRPEHSFNSITGDIPLLPQPTQSHETLPSGSDSQTPNDTPEPVHDMSDLNSIHRFSGEFRPNSILSSSNPNGMITIYHLKLMIEGLKKNLCFLPRFTMNADIQDLPARRERLIGEVLENACTSWADHLALTPTAGEESEKIIPLIAEFLGFRLLMWLEVLSVASQMSVAIGAILDVQKWLLDANIPDAKLLDFVEDSKRFIMRFYEVIELSAAHIYHSALPWSPESSLVRLRYQDELDTEVRILSGIESHWSHLVRTVKTLGPASSVLYSHAGRHIAVCGGGNSSRFIQFFQAETGILSGILETDTMVSSIAISPDDAFMLSASDDGLVMLWDINLRQEVKKFKGHKGAVNSIAFSSDGVWFASGSSDNTVRIWKVASGECQGTYDATSQVNSVCWLGGSTKVVAGCGDGSVRVLDVFIKSWLRTTSDRTTPDQRGWPVLGVASSADGSQMAAASGKIIQRHLSSDDRPLPNIAVGGDSRSVAFSPKNRNQLLVATNRSVEVWGATSKLEGRQFSTTSAAFSPDGASIASTSGGGFVSLWQSEVNKTSNHVTSDHHEAAPRICFSPDGKLFASGSRTDTKIWDALTGVRLASFTHNCPSIAWLDFSPDSSFLLFVTEEVYPKLYLWSMVNKSRVRVVAAHYCLVELITAKCSPDLNHLVSVSKIGVVRLWDLRTGECLSSSELMYPPSQSSVIFWMPDGKEVLLDDKERRGAVKRWAIKDTSSWWFQKGASFELVRLSDEKRDVARYMPSKTNRYRLSIPAGWILDESERRVCWIPPNCEGEFGLWNGRRFAVSALDGRVFIFDFSNGTL